MSVVYNVKNPSIFSISIKRPQTGDFFMLAADSSKIVTESEASVMREGLQSLGCMLEPMSVQEGETEKDATERLSAEATQLEADAKKAAEAAAAVAAIEKAKLEDAIKQAKEKAEHAKKVAKKEQSALGKIVEKITK